MTSTTSPLFAGLTITDAAPPQSAQATLQGDPIFEAMKASADKRTNKPGDRWVGQSKRIEIPAKAAPELEKRVRKSAEALNCGSSIRFRTKQGDKPVEIVSIGGKKDEKTGRMKGGTPEVRSDDKKLNDTSVVVAWFWAKSPNRRKTAVSAPVTNAPATPVTDAPATDAPATTDAPAVPAAPTPAAS